MSHELLRRALEAGDLDSLSADQARSLINWYEGELERLLEPLTPALWLMSEGRDPIEHLSGLLEQGGRAVDQALADPDAIRVSQPGRFPALWTAFAGNDPNLPEPPNLEWELEPDLERWTAAHPTLAAAAEARRARLPDRVGLEVVARFCDAVRTGIGATDSVDLQPLGEFRVSVRRAFTGNSPDTGEPISVPERRVAIFRAGPAVKRAIQTDGPLPEGKNDAGRVFRGVIELIRDSPMHGVTVGDLGCFHRSDRREFRGVNPATDAPMHVPARSILVFRASEELTTRMNGAPGPAQPAQSQSAAHGNRPSERAQGAQTDGPWWKFW